LSRLVGSGGEGMGEAVGLGKLADRWGAEERGCLPSCLVASLSFSFIAS
jgi:hypothetical protein